MKKMVYLLFSFLILVDCARVVSRRNENPVKSARGEVMEDLFDVYDPSYLAVVWPKIANGVHLIVEPPCWTDVSVFFGKVLEGRAWAYRAIDASGRYQSGVFSGNSFWLGSKHQCLQLDNEYIASEGSEAFNDFRDSDYIEVLRREKYFDSGSGDSWRTLVQRDELVRRLLSADTSPPYRLAYTTLQLELNVTTVTMDKSYDIILGVCLPRSCTSEDVASIVNFSIMINDHLKANGTLPRTVRIASLRQIEQSYDISADSSLIMLISATIFIITVAVAATIKDLKVCKCLSFNAKMNNFQNHHEMKPKNEMEMRKKKNMQFKNDSSNEKLEKDPTKLITLSVTSIEQGTGNCMRCGKYKKQCSNQTRFGSLGYSRTNCECASCASWSTVPQRRHSLPMSLFLCFSLSYSWKRIFNTNMANSELSLIHGLRITATLWMMFVHVTLIMSYVADDSGEENEPNNMYYILATGTLAFDSLFYTSGLFSSHHFFYLNSQYTLEELVSFGGSCGRVLQFICFIINRAIRLLPSYVFAVFLSGALSRVSLRTAALSLRAPDLDHATCDQYWWRNILYITTFYPQEERCMRVSWYISTETQLHALAAALCAGCAGAGAGERSGERAREGAGEGAGAGAGRRAAALLPAAALLAVVVTVGGDAIAEHILSWSPLWEAPWSRAASYLCGVLAGWLVHTRADTVRVSKLMSCCLWFASLSSLVASSMVPWLAHAWVRAWPHVTWPAALLWPTLVSAGAHRGVSRRLLDNSLVAAVSRLSYGALLLHVTIARSLILATDNALCSHTLCIFSYFSAVTVLTLLAALLLSLLVEMPCCSILRRLSDCAST